MQDWMNSKPKQLEVAEYFKRHEVLFRAGLNKHSTFYMAHYMMLLDDFMDEAYSISKGLESPADMKGRIFDKLNQKWSDLIDYATKEVGYCHIKKGVFNAMLKVIKPAQEHDE